MEFLYDLWPFNLPGGPDFLLLYGVLATILFGVGWLVGELLARLKERRPRPSSIATSTGAGPYRAAQVATQPPRLAVGTMPHPQDAWVIAYLRGGTQGVAEALFAAAVAAGWVQLLGASVVIRQGPAVYDEVLGAFQRKLASCAPAYFAVLDAARETAAARERSFEREVVDAGLRRPLEAKFFAVAGVVAAGVFVEAIGLVRCIRADALNRPYGFLVIMMTVVGFVTVRLARVRGATKHSSEATRYLRWLEDATGSFRSDVATGRRYGIEDVAMSAAIAGMIGLTAAPLFVGLSQHMLAPLVPASASPWASWFDGSGSSHHHHHSSCSASSCSSSSCSSGSGCGSSGCGGGGGCGG